MKKLLCILMSAFIFSCHSQGQDNRFALEKALPKGLKEISGIIKDGNALWAISDNNKAAIYKLDLNGNVIQELYLNNISLTDVEAVTADHNYLYIGDVGDNNGTRTSRNIIRVLKSSIGSGASANINGELISFTFPDEGVVRKKKSNNYDCEAMISFKDSLYVFTKRRDDDRTEAYALPKIPGTYTAAGRGVFKSKGLVTDAAVSPKGDELALVGYDAGHTRPFVWILNRFSGSNFFSGEQKRYELTNEKKLDWQIESVSYKDDNSLYIACEKTRDVANTLYVIPKSGLVSSKKD